MRSEERRFGQPRVALATACALMVTVLVTVVAPGGPIAAVEPPDVGLPVCVNPGPIGTSRLGCLLESSINTIHDTPADFDVAVSGSVSTGLTTTVLPAGLPACAGLSDTRPCYTSFAVFGAIGAANSGKFDAQDCNYLLDNDPEQARSCSMNLLYEPRIDPFTPTPQMIPPESGCSGHWGIDNEATDYSDWPGRASSLITCSWGFTHDPPNNLQGPTFFKLTARLATQNVCNGCGDFEIEVWAPMSGDLAGRASFNSTVGTSFDKIVFANTSRPWASGASYSWAFGDGTSSTATSPTHVYAEPGVYAVTLTMTGGNGETSVATKNITVQPSDIVVNSTGDGGLASSDSEACTTGGTIGGDPECTLRAAIQAANNRQGETITFDIDAGGAEPEIQPATDLPTLDWSIEIDGTTQEGGSVRISGSTDGETSLRNGLVLADGTSEITGLDIDLFSAAILVTGGEQHEIRGNVLGGGGPGDGLSVVGSAVAMTGGTGTTIEDNSARCVETACFFIGDASNRDFDGVIVRGNRMNLFSDGEVLSAKAGVQASVPVTVEDNWIGEIESTGFGISLIDAAAADSIIRNNRVGVREDGVTPSGRSYTGIFVNGVPRVSVTGNTVLTTKLGISIAGSDQRRTTSSGGSNTEIATPDNPVTGPVTGGDVTVNSNRVGVLAGGTAAAAPPETGIVVWGEVPRLTVSGNDVVAFRSAIDLLTGGQILVSLNRVGTDRNEVQPAQQMQTGVKVGAVSDVVVSQNEIAHASTGVGVDERSDDVAIQSNAITDTAVGIRLTAKADDGLSGVEISGNSIAAKTVGVAVGDHVTGTDITTNTITSVTGSSAVTGIVVEPKASATDVEDNVIVGVLTGVTVASTNSTVNSNRLGVERSGTERGITGSAIVVGNDVEVVGNVIRRSGGDAIVVDGADAIGRLRRNSIRGSAGVPIKTVNGPPAPRLAAVVDLPERGDGRMRTALVFTDLPTESGSIDVFSNGTCGDDPEARDPIGVLFDKRAGRSFALVTLVGREGEDGFTATFATDDEGTSALGSCVERTEPIDTDGDGSPDQLEALIGSAGDPAQAVVIADSGAPLLVTTTEGRLTSATPAENVPQAPVGVDLVYGALGFVVTDLPDGVDTAFVQIGDLDAAVTEGDSYWKYAPAAAGAPAAWFDLAEAGGAQVIATIENGLPIRSWQIALTDGGRGDLDGRRNGTIVDPGGPAFLTADFEPQPAPGLVPVEVSLHPLTPARVFETRAGEVTVDGGFEGVGRLAAGSVTRVQIGGRGGVDVDAVAVAVNVTAIRPGGVGYVTLFPCDGVQPLTSSLNFGAGGVAGNSGIVKLNAAGELCVFTFTDTDLVIDVNAWLAEVPSFASLTPARLVETRSGEVTVDGEEQELGRLAAGSVTEVQIAGRGGVAADADAVALNVTAIRPAGVGYVTLFPCDEERPTTSSLNYGGGGAVGNSAVVSLSGSGSLCVFTFADTDLVVDVNAWLADDEGFDAFVPARFFETRSGEETVDGEGSGVGRRDALSVTSIQVAGRGGVPVGASAVALNVTAVRPGGVGYVTLFPCDGDQPLTSSLNYPVGGAVGNSGIVKLAADGSVCAYTYADTDLVIDVNAAWTN